MREPLAILHDITDRIDAGFSDEQLTAVALERARRFERLLMAHGRAVTSGGHEALRAAFAPYLRRRAE